MSLIRDDSIGKLKQNLLQMTYIYSYRKGSFTLTSGRKSSYYIDGKQVIMSPAGLYMMARYILISIQEHQLAADAVGGLTLGADPIAAAVCALSPLEQRGNSLSCFIVRKEAKGHGTYSRIEGPFRKGLSTLIVDDVLTTGGSVLNAAAATEEAGGHISAIYVLVDREEGGKEEIAKAGYTLISILNRSDLEVLQQQMEEKYPTLFPFLQQEEIDWTRTPWDELSRFPTLQSKLSAAGEKLSLGLGSEPKGAAKYAQELLKVIKAAEMEPAGEAVALELLERIDVI